MAMAGSNVVAPSRETVSYTHLDVYKRQLQALFGLFLMVSAALLWRQAAQPAPGTVSYTHLDVYKRQVAGLSATDRLFGKL